MSTQLLRATGRALLTVACAVALALLRVSPQTWWAGSSFAAAATIFFFREPAWAPRVSVIVLGLVLAVVYATAHPEAREWITTIAYGGGTAAFCVAAARAITTRGEGFAQQFRTALVVSLFLVSLYVDAPLLVTIRERTPLTFDSALTAADQALGGNMSFVVGRFLLDFPTLRTLSKVAYYGLPVCVMLAAGIRWRRFGAQDRSSIPAAVALGAVVAPLLYLAVPAAGPVFRWATRFPFHPPISGSFELRPGRLAMDGVLNAMPSLHFAYALLVLWGTWSIGLTARAFGVAFAILTVIATLGLGEHYVVDLVVAVPLALLLWVVVERARGWRRVAVASAFLGAGWLVSFRLAPGAWGHPVIAWSAVAATFTGLAVASRRMWRGPSRAPIAVNATPE